MRERVFLFGDASARPEGLERALIRAGFSLVESASAEATGTPDLALVAVHEGGALESELGCFAEAGWAGIPVVVLLGSPAKNAVSRALHLGAADALAAPVDLAELCARLEARLRVRAEVQRAAGAGALQSELFHAIEAVAAAQRPEEMLETLVHRLGQALGASHCACLIPSSDRRHARLAAVHENPTLRGVAVDLFHYPEAVEAVVSGRTVFAPEVLRHRLFLAHLAQWPDSPEVHEVESSAAVPLVTHRAVRAVLVIRTRRGDPCLTTEQVAQVERLVNSTAALLEREDRRAGVARRQANADAIDPLTGCGTREAFERRLREEFERVERYGASLSLAILDAGALPEIGARLGTPGSDHFLAELAGLVSREIRGPDFVARHAGGELAILMPATGAEGARQLLGRIAARMVAHAWSDLPPGESPRLAAGLVTFPHPEILGPEDLLVCAEAALLRGGAGGADRVSLSAA